MEMERECFDIEITGKWKGGVSAVCRGASFPLLQDLSLEGEDKSWRSNEMDGEIQKQETEGIYLAIGQNQAIGLRNDFFDGKAEDETKVTALPTCPRCAANKGQWR
jgi:hypothetical protein